MIKSNQWIFEQDALIHPISNKVKGGLSYGINSYGYGIRLSSKDFKVFKETNDVTDPLRFKPGLLKKLNLDLQYPDSFVLPPLTAALGVSIEKLQIPNDISALVIGKYAYTRCGLILNTTLLEPGWGGHITLEFFNTTGSSIRLRTNQGIAQVVFFEGEPCWQPYKGKYQDQNYEVTLPK